MPQFPELPIVTPDPPRKSQAEKYGGLLYLGLGGLVVLVTFITLFGYGVWSMRQIWSDVYVLNDPGEVEGKRIQAGWRLANDPRTNDRQKWDLALSRTPPELARYLLAESLTAAAVEADPRAYGLSVARSEGWPGWLRALLARPLAYEAAAGGSPDPGPIRELAQHPDPFVALWARFALGKVGTPAEVEESRRILSEAAASSDLTRAFAGHLLEAASEPQPRANEALAKATRDLRRDHPGAVGVWRGWEETEAGVARSSAR